jgi:hypothetical protein
MGTLTNVWKRLSDFFALAVQGKGRAANAKVDAKKVNAAVQKFNQEFQPVLAEIEKHYKAHKTVQDALKKTSEGGFKLVQALKTQIVAANKDGYTQGDLKDDLEGRLSELSDRLKDLKEDGFRVPWD